MFSGSQSLLFWCLPLLSISACYDHEPGTSHPADAGTAGAGGMVNESWIKFDAETVVARSRIVLAAVNQSPDQFMPVGNGALGAAVWATDGLTAQLNRVDTFPKRNSPGILTIPGLAALTQAADFRGALDLYDAVLDLSGGGMTARVYVRANADELVVEVTGADPGTTQTATVSLWSPRAPQGQASGAIGTLSETWLDNWTQEAWVGGTGERFGSLAALTAGADDVQASTDGTSSISVSFRPRPDGSFRVICGSPGYRGGDATAAASSLLANDAAAPSADLERAHLAWWHDYWGRVGLFKMDSSDGAAEYVENLRTIYLYLAAAQSRGAYPGTQAGIADLFSFSRDKHQWFPAGFWVWNTRMQVSANMSSGAFEMNAPFFHLYLSNLANMQAWTRERMGNRPGICLPETMRFNGTGWYAYDNNQACDETIAPNYNSLTVSSGAEVGLAVWQNYLMTGDRPFLEAHYPLMAEAARFLLAYTTEGQDGLLHMTRSNAHETQWGVTDPITDMAAMRTLFPAVIAAAQTLGADPTLVSDLQAAIPKLPELPRTNPRRTEVLTSADDATANTIFAYSTQPSAPIHNSENLDLEPVWPYGLIGLDSSELEIARRTYAQRAFRNTPDWSHDAIHAARLGLGADVSTDLVMSIWKFQCLPSGLAAWDTSNVTEPYIEQAGVITTAINEALVQHYDGVLRIAPAWPAEWNVTGTVFIQGQSRVHVVFRDGTLAFAVLDAGSTQGYRVRNPWNGQAVSVIDGRGRRIVTASTADTLTLEVERGYSYLVKREVDPTPTPTEVTGIAATAVKTLRGRTIGVQ